MQRQTHNPVNESQCTCALIRLSARRITQAYDQALKETGLRITQYSILANLERNERLSITELAELLVMDRTTLTRNLQPLIRDGLIEPKEGADNRSKALELSDQGRDMLGRAKPLWQRTEASVREQLGQTELEQLRQLLARLT